jgi:hypothetical protein
VGVTADEAAHRVGRINPIAWMIGHLAWQEQLYWLERAQGKVAVPDVKLFGYGSRSACLRSRRDGHGGAR